MCDYVRIASKWRQKARTRPASASEGVIDEACQVGDRPVRWELKLVDDKVSNAFVMTGQLVELSVHVVDLLHGAAQAERSRTVAPALGQTLGNVGPVAICGLVGTVNEGKGGQIWFALALEQLICYGGCGVVEDLAAC